VIGVSSFWGTDAALYLVNNHAALRRSGASLVLYLPKQLREFDDVNDQYDFPPGAVSALTFELAKWLAPQYGQPWTSSLDQMCNQTLAVYQRGNTTMTDLGLDPALTSQAGIYNILFDSASGWGS